MDIQEKSTVRTDGAPDGALSLVQIKRFAYHTTSSDNGEYLFSWFNLRLDLYVPVITRACVYSREF